MTAPETSEGRAARASESGCSRVTQGSAQPACAEGQTYWQLYSLHDLRVRSAPAEGQSYRQLYSLHGLRVRSAPAEGQTYRQLYNLHDLRVRSAPASK